MQRAKVEEDISVVRLLLLKITSQPELNAVAVMEMLRFLRRLNYCG